MIRRSAPPIVLVALLALGACQADTGRSPIATTSPPAETPIRSAVASPLVASPAATVTLAPLPSGPDTLDLQPFASGLADPIGITHAGDGSGRLYVNERGGRVRVVEADGTLREAPFVDLGPAIVAGGEQGLLGVAFHPDYAANRRLFVAYTAVADGSNTIAELTAATDGETADAASLRMLVAVPDPAPNHNGGQLGFGPDGFLYASLGDGGGANDQFGHGQDPTELLGSILRLDVDARPAGDAPYAIPADNPFAANGARAGEGAPEVWAYGLRNPWRFSFDRENGDLYIGDVGQGQWEEIDRQPGDSAGGENYGWSVVEGRHCFGGGSCDQAPFVGPIAEYSHDQGCSVTAGYVYRGEAQPPLAGVYLFGDYCSGYLFTLQVDAGTVTPKLVRETGLEISAFGENEAGELYLASLGDGTIYRIVVS